jgi:DNA-directed RNA polymerase subunit RPC12/RpoP
MKIFKDKYTLKKHIGVHLGEFVCDICGSKFVNQVILERHKNEIHEPKSKDLNICEICDLSFTNARNLQEHVNIHSSNLNTYKCELCKKETTFKQKRNLQRHYLSHHNIVSKFYLRLPEMQPKEHKCKTCGKSFGRKERPIHHLKVNMCFSCPDCKFTCHDEKSLLEDTNRTYVKCKLCNFQTVYKFNLKKHEKSS